MANSAADVVAPKSSLSDDQRTGTLHAGVDPLGNVTLQRAVRQDQPGQSNTLDSLDLLLTFAPTLELGPIFALGGGKNLRAFVNLGARVSAFRERTLDRQVRETNARSLKFESTLTPAVANSVFNVGAQGRQLGGGFDLLLEYSRQSAAHLFTQTGTLRLAHSF